MAWFTDRHFFLLAVVVYGVSAVHSIFLWRKGFRRDDHVNYLLLLAAFALHTTAMAQRGYSVHHCPVNNLFEVTMFLSWTVVVVYLAIGLLPRLRFLGAFASPGLFAIGVFALMPGLDVPHGVKTELPVAWTSVHAALMSLSYGALGLSSVAALMYLTQERNLKFHKLRAVLSLMPPIQRLEATAARLLLGGLVLMTVALGIGVYVLAHVNNPEAYRGDPKVVWSVVVWLLYAGLAVLRWRFAWHGRKFALGVIGMFVFVLLTFWGTNLLSPLHHA